MLNAVLAHRKIPEENDNLCSKLFSLQELCLRAIEIDLDKNNITWGSFEGGGCDNSFSGEGVIKSSDKGITPEVEIKFSKTTTSSGREHLEQVWVDCSLKISIPGKGEDSLIFTDGDDVKNLVERLHDAQEVCVLPPKGSSQE